MPEKILNILKKSKSQQRVSDILEQEVLDITKIQTVEDLNSVDFSKYVNQQYLSWVRHITDPISSKELDRICDLSRKVESKIRLSWSMGELYYSVRALPQIKILKQMPLFNNEIFGSPRKFKVIPITCLDENRCIPKNCDAIPKGKNCIHYNKGECI